VPELGVSANYESTIKWRARVRAKLESVDFHPLFFRVISVLNAHVFVMNARFEKVSVEVDFDNAAGS
jgi:hypothetical protein